MSRIAAVAAGDALRLAAERYEAARTGDMSPKILAALQVEKDYRRCLRMIKRRQHKKEGSICLYRWSKMPCDGEHYADILRKKLNDLADGCFKVQVVLANGGWTHWVYEAVQVSW